MFRVLRQSVQHLNQRGYLFIWANVLCLMTMLPVVTAPAGWAGLTYLAYLSATQRQVSLEDFWEGFKQHIWRGLAITVWNVVILGINLVNLWGYSLDPSPITTLLRPVWIITIALWLTIQLYLWPILHHMQQPTLLGALRNAVVMIWLNPLMTLGMWLVLFIVWSVSTILAASWLLLTLSVMAIFLTHIVMDRLSISGYSE